MNLPTKTKSTWGGPARSVMLLCSFAYFASYVTRINYKVIISAIESASGIDREGASLALTGLFITYGLGQLVCGWIGDRIKPRYMIFSGLLISVVMNLLLPLHTNTVYMLVIWCINGFGQSMMWPPIVRVLSTHLKGSYYVKAIVRVSWASSLGTVVMYLVSPLIIEISRWQYVFVFSAIIGAVSAAAVLPGLAAAEKKFKSTAEPAAEDAAPMEDNTNKVKDSLLPLFRDYAGLFAAVICATTALGMLRDGVDTWMPSYISETFDFGRSASILTGVILPIFAILCHQAASMAYNKIQNISLSSGLFFGVAAVASVILSIVSKTAKFPVITVVCFAIIAGCMHGINLILVCILPERFAKYGRISTISGFINFFTYVGSALSIYGFAALSRRIGWTGTVVTWILISLLGAAFCFLMQKPFNKHNLSENNKM
ncbi:MAG: MFS transporter [Eubacteriales bacterium]